MSMNKDDKTNGRRRALIDRLENAVRDAIDASFHQTEERYPNGSRKSVDYSDERSALRDYVRNMAIFDKWEDLIERETKHERRHRRGAPNGWRFKFSAKHGALIVMLNNVGDGARRGERPAAESFIQMRDTAAEAVLVGYLARAALAAVPGLLDELAALDYAQAGRD